MIRERLEIVRRANREGNVIESSAQRIKAVPGIGSVSLKTQSRTARDDHNLSPIEDHTLERLDEYGKTERVPIEVETSVEVSYRQRDMGKSFDVGLCHRAILNALCVGVKLLTSVLTGQ
jgi:hypothetical protein